jgi:SAM-dependent methyltransferase
MNPSTRVNVYDSQSAAYQHAFQVFLDHTDQKARARDWLTHLLHRLPSRDLFLDAGAGNGKVTAWFSPHFQRTLALEPNPYLCEELRRSCPTAEVLPDPILAAQPTAAADLVLCSHVFYYIDGAEWMRHLEQLASWLAPDGVLVVVLQNHETDCMRLLEHFFGRRFDLSELGRQFEAARGDAHTVDLETVPAQVVTADFEAAYTVAEFILNLLPMPDPPARRELEEYVRKEFAAAGGGYRFSCDQDFLQIRRQAGLR